MIKVKVSTLTPRWKIIRQTPGSKGIWGDCEFLVDRDDVQDADWWVVYAGMAKEEMARCPKENTIFITGEPESIRPYDEKFLSQFAIVITSQRSIRHPGAIYAQQGLPWFTNFHSHAYDEMKAVKRFHKEKLMSVIASKKNSREGQQKRLDLIASLKAHFGDQLDVFGGGTANPVHDKWDGVSPYKYHLAIENGSFDDYWSEKLADSYLGSAYPFYYGCPNLESYFPAEAFTRIDVNDHAKTIEIIEHAIANEYYEKRQAAMAEARNLVLEKYNLFAMLAERCAAPAADAVRQEIRLTPEKRRVDAKVELLQKLGPVYKALRKMYRKYTGKKS